MRLRRRNKKTIDITPEAVFSERAEQETADFEEKENEQTPKETSRKKSKQKNSKKSTHDKVKIAKPVDDVPFSLFRRIVQNPNFSSQMMVIVFSLLSDNVPMQRPLENMTSAIDKVRNISDVLNSTMQSVKVASEVPKQIRRLLK